MELKDGRGLRLELAPGSTLQASKTLASQDQSNMQSTDGAFGWQLPLPNVAF